MRRYAALALSASGRRSQALSFKDAFQSSEPLTRLALLRGSCKLGADERRHWLERVQLDWFEKFVKKSSDLACQLQIRCSRSLSAMSEETRKISAISRCTAPSRGHHTASGRANCPACGGRSGHWGGGYSNYSYPSYSISPPRRLVQAVLPELAEAAQAVVLDHGGHR